VGEEGEEGPLLRSGEEESSGVGDTRGADTVHFSLLQLEEMQPRKYRLNNIQNICTTTPDMNSALPMGAALPSSFVIV
jgi:hypothetical protein